MTAIQGFIKPSRRPGELGIHSLDRFHFAVPDLAVARNFFSEFGLDIKKRSPFKQTLVIALDNDRPCYVPTLKAFEEGSYEVVNSRVKPGVGEQLANTAVDDGQRQRQQPACIGGAPVSPDRVGEP